MLSCEGSGMNKFYSRETNARSRLSFEATANIFTHEPLAPIYCSYIQKYTSHIVGSLVYMRRVCPWLLQIICMPDPAVDIHSLCRQQTLLCCKLGTARCCVYLPRIVNSLRLAWRPQRKATSQIMTFSMFTAKDFCSRSQHEECERYAGSSCTFTNR